jgi:hypothetical protein
MKLYKKREVVVLEETLNFARVHYTNEPEHKSFFAPKVELTEAPSKSVAARIDFQRAPQPIKLVSAGIVSPIFAEALKATNYRIRVLFPPHAEQSINASFSKAGVALPSDIRPQAVGKRKLDAQAPRSWSATVTFPAFVVTPNLIPDGTRIVEGKPNLLINSKRSIVLALLQAGLVINDYAK